MKRPDSVGAEVLFDVQGHLVIATLNRPDKRNAVNGAVTRAMDWIVREVEGNEEIRAAVLTSSLESTFCAGADLAEIAAGNGASLTTEDGGFAGFVDFPKTKPWIAAVRGNALAGGCELPLACDMIVAAEDSQFGLPEVKRGLFAGAGGVHRIVRALPRNVGLELVATGDPLPAERAYQLGLINRIVPSSDVLDTAIDLGRRIAANAPLSVRESLSVARLAQELSDADLRKLSKEKSALVMTSEDAKEGPRAFLEKREPAWSGR